MNYTEFFFIFNYLEFPNYVEYDSINPYQSSYFIKGILKCSVEMFSVCIMVKL